MRSAVPSSSRCTGRERTWPAADHNVVGVEESCTMLQRQMECVWTGKEGAEVARLGMVEAHRLPAAVHALRQLWLFVEEDGADPQREGGLSGSCRRR